MPVPPRRLSSPSRSMDFLLLLPALWALNRSLLPNDFLPHSLASPRSLLHLAFSSSMSVYSLRDFLLSSLVSCPVMMSSCLFLASLMACSQPRCASRGLQEHARRRDQKAVASVFDMREICLEHEEL